MALALLGDVRSASAQTLPTPTPTPSAGTSQPPQSDIYNLNNQQDSGPTFTFNTSPTECSQECQDAYRAVFADIHAFSQDRFGASVDTSDLRITIEPQLDSCGEFQQWSGIRIDHRSFCRWPNYKHVSSAALAHEYFHELQIPYILDRVGILLGTPKWFTEGSAEIFKVRWMEQYSVIPPHNFTYDEERGRVIRWVKNRPTLPTLRSDPYDANDPNTVDFPYKLGLLAIDYLLEQTSEGENKVATFVDTYQENPLLWGLIPHNEFKATFKHLFGISLNDFYACFAAHRAAGFPQPGAPCGASSEPPTPAPAASDGRIAFTSQRKGDADEIYAMNADGTEISRLTTEPAFQDYDPAWSSDGQRIAFSSHRHGGRSEIYVMNADGTGISRLTNNSSTDYTHYAQPTWSPDGQRIAFSSHRHDGRSEIYVMNADGTNVSRLTDEIWESFSPDWSPNGQRIAFSSDRSGYVDIYVMNADGSNVSLLTDGYHNINPAWSPDGQRIAFSSSSDRYIYGNWDIYAMNADGSNRTRLTNHNANDSHPTWSPDGQRIAFHSYRDGNAEIYVMNADGSNQTRLTNNPGDDLYPAWKPTGGNPVTPPPGDGSIADRVAQLERQVSALQSEANAQQTRIEALDRLLATLQAFIDALAARVAALESAAPQPPPFVPTPSSTPPPTPTPTPTPSPTATPTPAATINNACIRNIELASLIAGTTITGSWTTDCLAANPPSSGRRYAKFYTFTLGNTDELEFRITSDARHYYSLLSGAGTDGRALHSGEVPSGEQMQLVLQPGSYTLEVTTRAPNVTGDFTLELNLRR